MEPSPVSPGDVVAGKYLVERVLGAGGMGVVFAARHLQLGQLVAIKLMLPSASAEDELRQRFLREARAAARLRSQHVGKVLDVDTLETGAPYMVMEYLEGTDLRSLVGKRGPLPMAEAVEYVLQACEAIAEAHAAGIIHRDIKPANLFITSYPDGSPFTKVLDFGISKITGSDHKLTQDAYVLGSPSYMSPEQMQSSSSVDARTDIWAMGVVLYELLSGSMPFQGDSLQAIGLRVLFQAPPPLCARRPDIPAALEEVIFQCLEKERARRWENIAAFAAALAPFAPPRAAPYVGRVAGVLGVSVVASDATAKLPAGAMPAPQASVTAPMAPPVLAAARRPSRKRWGLGLLSAGAVVLAAAGWSLLRSRSDDRAKMLAPVASSSSSASMATSPAEAPVVIATSATPIPSVTAPLPSHAPRMSTSATSKSYDFYKRK